MKNDFVLNTNRQKMSFTGIRDIDTEILLKLNDVEICKVFTLNKYFNQLYEDDTFWYRRIINKIEKMKRDNFSKVKTLKNITVSSARIREMQKYFGFDKLKHLNNFLNKLPVNALYQEYFVFDRNKDDVIERLYGINAQKFPEYIDRQKLIYELRRNYTIDSYKLINNLNKLQYKSFSFNLNLKMTNTRLNPELFEVFQKMGIF